MLAAECRIGYGHGSNIGKGTKSTPPSSTHTPLPHRKRKQQDEKNIKQSKDVVRYMRRLQNKLGSLDSMFDIPTKKTTTKRAVKRVSRA